MSKLLKDQQRFAFMVGQLPQSIYLSGFQATPGDAHEQIGLFWESIGGTWGGRWGDGNHYSLGEVNG